MKYIMFELELEQEFANVKSTKQKIPIIFPNQLVHREIATAVTQALKRQYGDKFVQVVSAGDCTIECISVSGESETLKLKNEPCDMATIDMYDYLHGL